MSNPDEDMIVTLDATTGVPEVLSNIKANSGTLTRATADEPIQIVADDGLIIPIRTTTERDAIVDPQDGAVIFISTDDELQIYHSAQWNGSAYGNMYQRLNAVVTTINTVGVFEDVLNFTAGELKETTFSSSVLATGDITATYQISYGACISGSTNKTFESAIEVDGAVRDESASCATVATGGNDVSLGSSFILTIGPNKDIKMVIRNATDTSNLTVIDASVSITRIRQ